MLHADAWKPDDIPTTSQPIEGRREHALPPHLPESAFSAGHRAGGPGPHPPHQARIGPQFLGLLLRDPQLTRAGVPSGEAGVGVTMPLSVTTRALDIHVAPLATLSLRGACILSNLSSASKEVTFRGHGLLLKMCTGQFDWQSWSRVLAYFCVAVASRPSCHAIQMQLVGGDSQFVQRSGLRGFSADIAACRHSMRPLQSWTPLERSLTRTAPSSCSCCATTSLYGHQTCRQELIIE